MISIDDIYEARSALKGLITHTPFLRAEWSSREIGANIFVKAECLQRAGSFKIRGAFNKISHLDDEQRTRGVIAASAGNHAQGVALAATTLKIRSTIVMPEHAPLTKVNATRAFGAKVILHGATFDDAMAHAEHLQREHGYTFVHPFNDPFVIAGQGTIGLELFEANPDLSTVVVPIGGGGMIGGIAIALKTFNPSIRIIGVQAEGCSSIRASLVQGAPVVAQHAQTIADGIAVKRPGDLTLPIIKRYVDEVVEVTDDEIALGIAHCLQHCRLVVEGAGAAGLAAVLTRKFNIAPDETIGVILGGGNIDGNLMARVIEQVMVRQGRYIFLKMSVIDRPGALAPLLDEIATCGANVIDIFHRRAMWLAPLGKVGIELVLEVRDEAHARGVVNSLISKGYHVAREGQGYWPD